MPFRIGTQRLQRKFLRLSVLYGFEEGVRQGGCAASGVVVGANAPGRTGLQAVGELSKLLVESFRVFVVRRLERLDAAGLRTGDRCAVEAVVELHADAVGQDLEEELGNQARIRRVALGDIGRSTVSKAYYAGHVVRIGLVRVGIVAPNGEDLHRLRARPNSK